MRQCAAVREQCAAVRKQCACAKVTHQCKAMAALRLSAVSEYTY